MGRKPSKQSAREYYRIVFDDGSILYMVFVSKYCASVPTDAAGSPTFPSPSENTAEYMQNAYRRHRHPLEAISEEETIPMMRDWQPHGA